MKNGISHKNVSESERNVQKQNEKLNLLPTKLGYLCSTDVFFRRRTLTTPSQRATNVICEEIFSYLYIYAYQVKKTNTL